MNRRGFFKGIAVGVVGIAVKPKRAETEPSMVIEKSNTHHGWDMVVKGNLKVLGDIVLTEDGAIRIPFVSPFCSPRGLIITNDN